ncbi:MAG: competence protein ComEC [Verrucomicrobiota bacterium]|nr:competence protein ComEC [Verrucomicrobiota bacterium]MDK2963334.1 competence protein ComEC [Verrucomicrobiota bacterium]
MRRPLTAAALSVAGGLWLGQCLRIHPLFSLGISALLLALLCRKPSSVLFYLVGFSLAAACISVENALYLQSATLSHPETGTDRRNVAGKVISDPVDQNGQTSFRLKTDAVCPDGSWIRSRNVIQVYLRNPKTPVLYGQRWKIAGRYTGYERRFRNASGVLSAAGKEAVLIPSPAHTGWIGRCYEIRRRAAGILEHGMEAFPEQTRLLHALLLGYRQSLPADLYQTFAATGTLHIFAISGLHVGLIAAILIAVLKIAGVPKRLWGLLLIPSLLFYTVSTGMKPSALRAFTMAAVYFIAPLAGRRPDVPSAVALAAILMLAVRPEQISDPGFLLSFTVVSGIVMVHGFTVRRINGIRTPRWTLPLRQSGAAPLRGIGLLGITSLAAWLFSAPLTALFFNTFSPAAPVGNLVIIPMTFMIVLTGCLTLFSGAFFPAAGLLFSHANRLFIDLLLAIIHWIAEVPGTWRFIRAPTEWTVLLWYSGLTLLFAGPARLRRPAVLLVLLALLLWGIRIQRPVREIELFAQRDSATALHLPPDRWILVSDGDPFYTARTIRLLQRKGVNRLRTLVISDARADAETVTRLQRFFHPQQTRSLQRSGRLCWPVGEGTICLSPGRAFSGDPQATPRRVRAD